MDGNEHQDRAELVPSREAGPVVIHASALAWSGRCVLVLGRSGAGKSGLALRLMALGASLIADDRVCLRRSGKNLLAAAPNPLRGLIEARGVGVLRVPHAESAVVFLAVDLDQPAEARLPEKRKIALLGCNIDLISGRDVPNLDAIITVVAQNRADMI